MDGRGRRAPGVQRGRDAGRDGRDPSPPGRGRCRQLRRRRLVYDGVRRGHRTAGDELTAPLGRRGPGTAERHAPGRELNVVRRQLSLSLSFLTEHVWLTNL